MKKNDKIFQLVLAIIMVLIGIATLYPFWHIIVISVSNPYSPTTGFLKLWPSDFNIESYIAVFKDSMLYNSFMVSIFRVVIGVSVGMIITTMYAYVLAKKDFRFSKAFNIFLVVVMYIPVGLIPFFLVVKELHITNTFAGLVVPFMFGVFECILIKNYFVSLPKALEEAAKIDGASEFRIYWQIYLPLSKAVIATAVLFMSVYLWNDYIYGSFLVTKQDLQPIQYTLYKIINNISNPEAIKRLAMSGGAVRANGESVKMAAIVITTIPILLVYPFVQKHLVKGVMIGSVKE